MTHIEVRDLEDDDLDAVFDTLRDEDATERIAFGEAVVVDRSAFDEWMLRERASADTTLFVVTDDGGYAGVAATLTVEGRREVAYVIARNAQGRGVGAEALRLLVSREADRPLYLRTGEDAASDALLARLGFTAFGDEPGLFVLPPTLE